MPGIQTALNELHERLTRLERIHTKTNRGRTNQRGAAQYLGNVAASISELFICAARVLVAVPTGSYSFDDLDAFAERNTAERKPAACSPSLL